MAQEKTGKKTVVQSIADSIKGFFSTETQKKLEGVETASELDEVIAQAAEEVESVDEVQAALNTSVIEVVTSLETQISEFVSNQEAHNDLVAEGIEQLKSTSSKEVKDSSEDFQSKLDEANKTIESLKAEIKTLSSAKAGELAKGESFQKPTETVKEYKAKTANGRGTVTLDL